MTTELKPFVLNIGDIQFLLSQVNLRPLFNASGELVFNWHGDSTVYASKVAAASGTPLFTPGDLNATDPLADAEAAIAAYGKSYYSVADAAGLRDVSGLANNLDPANAAWGAADVPFLSVSTNPGDLGYGHYVTGVGVPADYTITGSGNAVIVQTVTDYTPRMITQTIMTGGVKLLLDAAGHIVHWDPSKYTGGTSPNAAYIALINDHLINVDQQVEGAAIVDMKLPMLGVWNVGLYALGLLIEAYNVQPGVDYHFNITNSLGEPQTVYVPYSADAVALVDLVTGNNIDISGLVNGSVIYDATNSPYGLLAEFGVQDQQNPNNGEYFIESQNPGVAPTNGFFAVFGQFFDHGLDFIGKGGNANGAKIIIPLAATDPLYGVIGQNGQPTTSITISRATVDHIDANGIAQYVNHTSPFIDQSQTYGSINYVTDILREWVIDPNTGAYIAGAKLLDGYKSVAWTDAFGTDTTATLPTLNELRAHLAETGRADLSWEDVNNLRIRDASGQLLDTDAGTAGVQTQGSGHALLLDMNPHFSQLVTNGNATSGHISQGALDALNLANGKVAGDTGFIQFDANGQFQTVGMPMYAGIAALMPFVNFANFDITATGALHDAVSEILMQAVGDHYLAGDGRVNENVALTSIHHIFHMEHGFQTQNLEIALFQQDAVVSPTDHSVLHQWQVAVTAGNVATNTNIDKSSGHWVATAGILARDAHDNFYVVDAGTSAASLTPGHSLVMGRGGDVVSAVGNYTDAAGFVAWDQEKLFQGIKLIVEMEYQHTAVDQYARAVTPDIPEFSGYSTDLDATISMAYSQGAFRFGHSTLRETIDTMDPNGDMTGRIMSYALQKAFLNPALYEDLGAASIVMGMTKQVMNDIDEFITPALQQGLLDLPMDLAAINIARGRDVGLPTLNQMRGLLDLTVYTSWNDFSQNMYHIESFANFIAAYSFDGDVTHAQAILDAANGLINTDYAESASITAAVTFLNGGNLDFNKIDLWVGGLAEAHISGGLLGETFNVVFVDQIQRLQDGDRFYYLYRLAGTNFGDEIINEQFKDIVERTTGTTHLNGNIFGYADNYYELGDKAVANSQSEHKYGYEIDAYAVANDGAKIGVYSNGGTSLVGNGGTVVINGKTYVVDLRPDLQPDILNTDGTPTSGANSYEVIAGTNNDDLIYLGFADDTGYGDEGDDIIYGGSGGDRIYGGGGNDTLYGDDLPDVVDGGEGDDLIYGGDSGSSVGGFDQLIGGSGNDTIYGGVGIDKIFGNGGDDALYGEADTDPFMFGGDGNDIVDGGNGQDNLYGNAGDDVLVGGADKDILFGQAGDDILRPGVPTGAANAGSGNTGNGVFGPDEVVGGMGNANEVDLGFDILDLSDNISAYQVEINLAAQQNPLIGLDQNQVLATMFEIDGLIGTQGNDLMMGNDGTAAGAAVQTAAQTAKLAGNWLIGGKGSDTFEADIAARGAQAEVLATRAGNDVIVGGSIRLDALIGKYFTTGGALDLYESFDALIGASHRVASTSTLVGGLLNSAALMVNNIPLFDLHFTEMLKSFQFKDWVLGDGLDDSASTDTVAFSGNVDDYAIVALDILGNVIADPTAHLGQIYALKITDNGYTPVDINDPMAARSVVDGTTDGTDLVIGVESFKFADGTKGLAQLFGIPPTLDLEFTGQSNVRDTFNSTSYSRQDGSVNWVGNWIETNDSGNNSGAGEGNIYVSGGQLRFDDDFNGTASIQRGVNLSGATSATLTFDFDTNSLDAGDYVKVYFAASNGGPLHELTTIISPLTNSNSYSIQGTSSFSINLATVLGAGETLGAGGVLKFEVVSSRANQTTNSANSLNGGYIAVDNVNIDIITPDTDNNYTTTYTEGNSRVAIAPNPVISDDKTVIVSAQAVLTNAVAGDLLRIGNSNNASGSISIPGPDLQYSIDSSVSGQVTLTIIGESSLANYQNALQQIRFYSTSATPTIADRTIDVTVNDGKLNSAVATATVHVIEVDSPPVTNSDRIVSNFGNGNQFSVPDWALLANDYDPEGNALTITSVAANFFNSLSASHSGLSVNITDNAFFGDGGSFTYRASDGSQTSNGSVTLVSDTNGAIDGNNGNDILVGNASNSVLNGNGGDDIIFGGGGNDTIDGGTGNDTAVWFVGDGRDRVNGGDGTDTFIVNGDNNSETFRIYSMANGGSSALPSGLATGLLGTTEIVITRQIGTGAQTIVAELDNIEEIVVNGTTLANATTNAGGDTVAIIGDFTGTSLALNTIHINGGSGDDTVDISQLTSDHRIVFATNGGNDHVIGDLRPQDIVETTVANNGNIPQADGSGSNAQTDGSGSDPQTDEGTQGQIGGGHQHHNHHDYHDHDLAMDDADTDHDTSDDVTVPTTETTTSATAITGTEQGETLLGHEGRDMIFAGGGNDNVLGGGGADMLFGDGGNDRIFGEGGNDFINAGAGNDTVFGGDGDDLFVAETGDGNDTYYGDDLAGGNGIDTLDMSSIMSAITADLGNGMMNRGGVYSAETGNDVIWGIENIITGSGNDTITANDKVNVIDGGAGADVFRFLSSQDADGDTIVTFQPGDKIDLSGIDANSGTSGNQSFTLVSGGFTGALGELMVSHESRADGEYTLIEGNAAGNSDSEFKISIKGHHDLTASDFNL